MTELTPPGFSVRSRVYEYGGGSFCLSDDGVLFVNEADQQLYHQPLNDERPVALTSGEATNRCSPRARCISSANPCFS